MLVTDIIESLNIKADLTWEKQGVNELTGFVVNDSWIIIQVTKLPITDIPVLKNKRTAEVSFRAENPSTGEIRYDALNIFTPKESMLILSIVYNALVDKLVEYDAFYFTAEKRYTDYKKKATLYYRLTNRLAKSHNFVPFSKETPQAMEFIVSKIQFKLTECGKWSNEIMEFVHHELGPKLTKPKIITTKYTNI